MAQRTPNEYYEEDMAKAKNWDSNQKVMVCPVCGDIDTSGMEKDCRHTTSFIDGSYGYYIERKPYRMVLTEIE